MSKELNSYDLSRDFFDWSFSNPEKVRPNHIALYFFIIEHCNRLGWKEKFGLPTSMAKEAIGIRSYNTYIQTLNELSEWGFIYLHERSKNQYSSNIIAISKNDKALDKALDKAFIKHATKQSESTIQSTGESISSIDKPRTIEQVNQEQGTSNTVAIAPSFNFKKELLNYGFEEKLVDEWLSVRKSKKAKNTETAFNGFIREVEKSSKPINEVLRTCVEKSWQGFNADWLKNQSVGVIQTKQDLTKQILAKRYGNSSSSAY